MEGSYTLYGRPGSGSVAVQVALEELQVRYERVWVGKSAEELARYRQLNPAGRVPALRLPEGTVIAESAAILIHLGLRHSTPRLAPAPGTTAHARFLQWMVFLSANVYAAALRYYYSSRYSVRAEVDAEFIRDQAAEDYLTQLELIARELSPYVLGDEFTLVDIYLHMLASWSPLESEKLFQRAPALGTHARLLQVRPSVIKVDADNVG